MTYTVEDYYKAIDKLAPFALAESWDNAGLLVGSMHTKVTATLVCLDVTDEIIGEATKSGSNLIISHHPVIYPHVSRVDCESVLYRLISSGISVISAHTNYDLAQNGVNDTICRLLDLADIQNLASEKYMNLARIGTLKSNFKPIELANFVKLRLDITDRIKFTCGTPISTVAVCAGSGGDLWFDAYNQGAQALVTAEVKHHQFVEAKRLGFTLIDAGHYSTEVVAMPTLANQLKAVLPNSPVAVASAQSCPTSCI